MALSRHFELFLILVTDFLSFLPLFLFIFGEGLLSLGDLFEELSLTGHVFLFLNLSMTYGLLNNTINVGSDLLTH